MTPRERMYAALEFRTPDRTPRDLWPLPWMGMYRPQAVEAFQAEFPMDVTAPGEVLARGDRAEGRPCRRGEYVDDWGSRWRVAEDGVIGEVCAPALADWADLDGYQPPWEILERADWDAANRAQEANLASGQPRFMRCSTSIRPFERLQFLRGTENVFVDLAYGTAEVRALIERIHEFNLAELDGWAKVGGDCLSYMDDWGAQSALLIHPDAWRDLFKPLYAEYNRRIHAAGKKAFFHSDGHISAIYADLVEVGFDAINSQLFCMDIEELGRCFAGRVTFWGEIDRQHVLPFGDVHEVRRAVGRVRRALDKPAGGVIAQCEWGKNVPDENVRAVFEAWDAPLADLPGVGPG